MAQFYTLEEAARVLGMSPEDLKQKAQQREVRAFMDGGSWQFRVADVDELARRRGLGSDPELLIPDSNLDVPDGSGSGEIDLSEFQLGTGKSDLTARTMDIAGGGSVSDDDQDVQFDDLSLPPGPLSSSSSTIIGMNQKKPASDSDVRLMPDKPLKGRADSQVRLRVDEPLSPPSYEGPMPSDSDVTLVNDEDSSLHDVSALRPNPGAPSVGRVGSSAEISTSEAPDPESSSDFELMPSTDITAALEPESGSDFELTALDASDEFEATPLTGPSDSDVTAAQPSASGINLARPSDSGINLQTVGGFDLSQADSIELAPLDDEPVRPASKSAPKSAPKPAAKPAAAKAQDPNSATRMPGLDPNSATRMPGIPMDPGATSMGLTEKDIFEDTDFSLEVDALDSDHDDRTVQLDRSSDFDLEESGSASEVFALDEDDVDQNAATAMGAAVADDDSGEFSADDAGSGEMSSGWDVESEAAPSSASMSAPAAAAVGSRLVSSAPQAEWGGIWVGLLGVTTFLVFISMVFSYDLVQNLYDFQRSGPASGLINSISGMFK
jgi:excisionase family DNA binding protein